MAVQVPGRLLLAGFGRTNQAVAAGLVARGHGVVITDDRPSETLRARAASLSLTLIEAPDEAELASLLASVDALVAAPGLPERHPAFSLAEARGLPSLTEFDLAAAWDDRPVVAITGTNGKTTVTTLVAEMLRTGGIACVEAGNNEVPLVEAIDDPGPEWFVVEASSFRLARTHDWRPRVATWLNLAPDHLDVHATHAAYEAAKARIFQAQGPDDVAIGNLDDPVVAGHLCAAPARRVGYLVAPGAVAGTPAYRVEGDELVGPGGTIVPIADLPRRLGHDLSNALAAAATAEAAGCSRDAVARVLVSAAPLPHRVSPVATIAGVTYYDDSKATVPHATLAAVRSFDSVVLIAGGRNKGLDLTPLADAAEHIRAVVAIGDSAAEVAAAFASVRPTETATTMADAVAAARRMAEPGDAVLLSPACASFDWYTDYGARGDDFAAHVRARGDPMTAIDLRSGAPRAGRKSRRWLPSRAHGGSRAAGSRAHTDGGGRSSGQVLAVAIGVLVLVLALLGSVMILSASSVVSLDRTGSAFGIFVRQAVWLLIGIFGFFVGLRIDHERWRSWVPLLVLGSLGLLGAVLVPGVGVDVNGAQRWIGLGFAQLQPAEPAKLAMVVFCAAVISRNRDRIHDLRVVLRPVLMVLGLFVALLMAQPNLGTSAVLCTIVGAMLLWAGIRGDVLAGLAASGFGLGLIFAYSADYRRARLTGFLDPWENASDAGYQSIQSLIGVASGGVSGTGLGASRSKWGFLPEAHTDFVFAIIGEELGLIGALVVVALVAGIVVCGMRVAHRASSGFGELTAVGITTWFAIQAFVNVGAVLGLLPITGVPLPFVSFGGSSLLATMLAAGILANIVLSGEAPEHPVRARTRARRAGAPGGSHRRAGVSRPS